MKYSICIYSKITTNNFQKEYVYAHLLNNRDAWDSNDNKPYFPLITNSPQNLQITQRQQSAVKRETAGTSKTDMS